MTASLTIDKAFLRALCNNAADDEQAPALQQWHLGRMGPRTLADLVHKQVGAASSESARAIMDKFWRLPRLAQAQVLEENFVCGYVPADFIGPPAPLGMNPTDQEQDPLFPPEWRPIVAVKKAPSRLSRELQANIYIVDWGSRTYKPEHLWRWRAGKPPVRMTAVAGKENGKTYYCRHPLSHSPTARALLAAGFDFGDLYARLPLLLSEETLGFIPFHAQCRWLQTSR